MYRPTRSDLDAFRPLVAQLRVMQRHCRPFGSDYDALALPLAALDEMAERITGRCGFFGDQNDTVGPIMPPPASRLD
jgi:hypothetical protein